MTVIECARELGKALQEDERYAKFSEATKNSDNDTEMQNKIGEFNMLRMKLNQEMSKPEKDNEAMTKLDNDIKALYNEIMEMPTMKAYNDAKEELDSLLQSVNYIISMAANGEDPMTCPEQAPQGCGGSCSTCGGCH
ncbi:MAG: YlbF family regulator [Ruminococcus sp.]|nr:YlbF family regulator [Ruminococcus sp.]